MFHNFTSQYKQLLLQAENTAKEQHYHSLESNDLVFELLKSKSTEAYEIFIDFGINEKVFLDVLTHPKFKPLVNRTGDYVGISEDLRDIIVSSVKIAASYEKTHVGVLDFLLALLKQSSGWFLPFLDFIRVNPRDFEGSIIEKNKNMVPPEHDQIDTSMAPLGKILNVLEQGLFSGANMDDMEGNPMFGMMGQSGGPGSSKNKKGESQTPALDFFCTDLTKEAQEGEIDPIIGRDIEIERLISVLNRKTKNNPVIVGDPGVGKTAIVEGLALRISSGDVPFAMQHKRILMLDMATMVAGTKYRGEFEVRMKQVIEEASKLENEVILFIDEIHTIIGAGGSEGTLDAANILKPAMGRAKIRIIGATTLNEYQKHIEKDSALERRFQKINADEPSTEVANKIILGLKETFEEYHNLIIEESAIYDAVDLSVRYLTDRFLPDKAIDLIDEACSAKSMTYEHVQDEIQELKLEIEKIQKHIEDFVTSQQYHKASQAKDKQLELEAKIREKRMKISIPREKRHHITSKDIQKVVHQITGVPMKTLSSEDLKKLKILQKNLQTYIVGQEEGIESVVNTIKRSHAGISDKNRPLGSFLFLGPTGVGKTELVKVLAHEYYGDEKALIKIDMSEFSERSSSSKLIGTTAGYIGYDDGGVLTDKVRRKPYSVVLFDEIEKGNHEVYNLLLQIMEDGYVTDGKGRRINFRNTIIVMTSNLGGEEFNQNALKIGFHVSDEEESQILHDFEIIRDKVMKNLDASFSPEFINRIDKIIVFRPLDKNAIKKIIVLQLHQLARRMQEQKILLHWTSSVVTNILKETYNPEFGARPIRRFIQVHIEDKIADEILGKKVSAVEIGMEKNQFCIQAHP